MKQQTQYKTFTDALRKVLSVPRAEMQRRLEEEKKAKASTPRPPAKV